MTDRTTTPNDRYPGRPNYTGPDAGLALFVHDSIMAEYCRSFHDLLAYIEAEAPVEERALRRHWLVYIGDRLPDLQALENEYRYPTSYARSSLEIASYMRAWDFARPSLEALRVEFAADAPWDGTQLVFPMPHKDDRHAANHRYPGRPNYTGPDEGLALFVHHGTLAEYCWSFVERLVYIDTEKPPHERTMRRQWLVYVGDRVPEVEPAWAAYMQARQAYMHTRQAYMQAYIQDRQAYTQAWETTRQTYMQARQDAQQALDDAQQMQQAYRQALAEAHPQLEALRLEFAAEAPWDGKQLVFPKDEE